IQRERRRVGHGIIHGVKDRAPNLILAGVAAIANETAPPAGTPRSTSATSAAPAESTAAKSTARAAGESTPARGSRWSSSGGTTLSRTRAADCRGRDTASESIGTLREIRRLGLQSAA